jgi:hypothetical protein
MKIKRKPIVFHNLFYMTRKCPHGEWLEIALGLRDFVIAHGLYINAPIVYQCADRDEKEGTYTVYVPVNAGLSVEKSMPFSFMPELYIEDALVFRLADLEAPGEEEAHLLLEACAHQEGCDLVRPFYNVCLTVYDELLLDIVAPIEKKETIS